VSWAAGPGACNDPTRIASGMARISRRKVIGRRGDRVDPDRRARQAGCCGHADHGGCLRGRRRLCRPRGRAAASRDFPPPGRPCCSARPCATRSARCTGPAPRLRRCGRRSSMGRSARGSAPRPRSARREGDSLGRGRGCVWNLAADACKVAPLALVGRAETRTMSAGGKVESLQEVAGVVQW
jgi:hypothetical protein